MKEPERIGNFRCLGGLKNTDGRVIRSGVLLRCGALISASDQDLELLSDTYKVRTVVDFRSDYELGMAPDRMVPGAVYHHLPLIDSNGDVWKEIFSQGVDGDPMDLLIKFADRPQVQKFARSMYIGLALDPDSVANYRRFMRLVIEQEEGAILWHCSQGKDRTGMGAAYVLAALGCDVNTIVADYDLSNWQYSVKVREYCRRWNVTDPEVRNVIRTFVGANVDYFKLGINAVCERYGTMDNFLHECLGVSGSDVRVLRERYLI